MFSPINLIVLLAAEDHGVEPNPMEFSAPLAIFTLLVFVGLVLVLGKYAWTPILAGLEKREKSIADQIDQANQANEKAQANLQQYEQRLADAADEANKMLTAARNEANNAKERIMAEANAEAQRQRDRAVAEIEAAKNQAVRELAEKSVDSAVSLAGRLVGKEIDPKAHSELIKQSLDRFSQST